MSFKDDVENGLGDKPKHLSSKYFYDAEGDKIFQAIMRMPEYYLTDSEYEIFSTRAKAIFEALSLDGKEFDLVEFGAGDGFKTKILIEGLLKTKARFRYLPIDISGDVLRALKKDLNQKHPELEVLPENTDYFQALENISAKSGNPKLVLFIGSSIGNFRQDKTVEFLKGLYEQLNSGDKVLIGYDLQKNPKIILKAYNDEGGITKAFNMNVLKRINRELGGDFDLEAFDHYPTYDPESGLAKSYLVSLKTQEVRIEKLNTSFKFAVGEAIHTEISRKYTIPQIEDLFDKSNFKVIEHFFDCKHYYVDTLIEKS